MDFAAEVLLAMVNTWNSKISELSDEIRERCGQQFLQQQDSMIDTEAAGPDADRLDEQATKQLDHLLEFLRPCHLTQTHTAFMQLDGSGVLKHIMFLQYIAGNVLL